MGLGYRELQAEQVITLAVQSVGISESDTLFDSFVPGNKFDVLSVQHFAEAVTATASYTVKIGTAAATSATTPTADTRGDATLTASVRGTATDALNLHCTTDGTGAFTGLKVKVRVRFYPPV